MTEEFLSAFGLENQQIWVVGAAGYLGQSTVKLLQSAGATVLCIDIEDRAKVFVDSLPSKERLTSVSLNTRNTVESVSFVNSQIEQRGIPDGLIDLSVGTTAKAFDSLTAADFDEVNHNGITTTFIFSREVANAMKAKNSGSIVLFSSMYGSVSPDPNVYEAPMNVNPVEYGVGKAGIVQMARYMAVHYAKSNIRFNCISPGPFPKPHIQKEHPEFIERLAKKVPLGRIGRPEEVAGVAVFLVGSGSSFITGQNIFVDGGWTVW